MNLKERQKFVNKVLMTKEGHQATKDEESWLEFCKKENIDTKDLAMKKSLANYQDLMCFSVKEALKSIYPFTVSFFKDDVVKVAEYYRRVYPNQSFQMNQAVKAFPKFLADTDFPLIKKLVEQNPYLAELARYEWLEVEPQNAKDFDYPDDFHKVAPMVPEAFEVLKAFWNPTAIQFRSIYPITKIIKDLSGNTDQGTISFIPHVRGARESYNVVIYRDPDTLKVRFIELTKLAIELFDLSITKSDLSYGEILNELNNQSETKVTKEQAINLFKTLFDKQLLLGSLEVSA